VEARIEEAAKCPTPVDRVATPRLETPVEDMEDAEDVEEASTGIQSCVDAELETTVDTEATGVAEASDEDDPTAVKSPTIETPERGHWWHKDMRAALTGERYAKWLEESRAVYASECAQIDSKIEGVVGGLKAFQGVEEIEAGLVTPLVEEPLVRPESMTCFSLLLEDHDVLLAGLTPKDRFLPSTAPRNRVCCRSRDTGCTMS